MVTSRRQAKPPPLRSIEERVTCREFADFIGDYLSNELSPESRSVFERHISRCPNCRRYLAGYEQSVKLGERAFEDEQALLSSAVPEDLVSAILVSRIRRRSK